MPAPAESRRFINLDYVAVYSQLTQERLGVSLGDEESLLRQLCGQFGRGERHKLPTGRGGILEQVAAGCGGGWESDGTGRNTTWVRP